MIERLCYVYGVVRSSVDPTTAPNGIDGGPVSLISNKDVSALATSVSAEDYAPERVESLTADVDALSRREGREGDALQAEGRAGADVRAHCGRTRVHRSRLRSARRAEGPT